MKSYLFSLVYCGNLMGISETLQRHLINRYLNERTWNYLDFKDKFYVTVSFNKNIIRRATNEEIQ